jgi:hypothetical protein
MLMNGIDYTARKDAMTAVGIDPDGLLSEYARVLDTKYVYCNQHLNLHSTESGCTVGLIEQFPLKAVTLDEAREEVRARGFALYLEATTCSRCGEAIILDNGGSNGMVTVEDRVARCAKPKNMFGTHSPVPSVPLTESASL